MPDASTPLSAILDDPNAMARIAALAGELSGGQSSAPSAPSVSSEQAAPAGGNGDNIDPASELMQRAVPILSSIAQSGRMAADSDRLRLLTALKPFLAPSVASQLDHAARLLSMAYMARTATRQIFSAQSGGTQEV